MSEHDGFVAEPRILSHEVAQMKEQVSSLCDAVLQLVDLQREANKRLEAALQNHQEVTNV